MQMEICLSHYARSWYVLFMVFVLQEIRCWIWVEVRCRNVIIGWRVRGGHSHEPKSAIFISCQHILHQLSHAVEIFIKVLVGLTCLIHRQSGLPMFKSCWPLRGSVGTGSTCFSLNCCIQVSSSSSLSHFQVWCSRVQTRNDLTSFQKF